MAKPKTTRKSNKSQSPAESIEDAEIVDSASSGKEPAVPEEISEPDAPVEAEAAARKVPDPQLPRRRSGGFLWFLFGGLVAGAIGFGVATYFEQKNEARRALLKSEVDGATARLGALEAQLASVEAALVEEAAAKTGTASEEMLEGRIAEVVARIDRIGVDIDTRLSALELRSVVTGGDVDDAALAAYQSELIALRSQLGEQAAEISALRDATNASANSARLDAEAASLDLTARAALLRMQAALDSGGGFAKPLADFEAATGAAAPEALRNTAGDGVPTLAELQRQFAPAARTALAAARSAPSEASATERFAAFLQNQLGARSLEARDGSGADAVLSRAEAALRRGDLGAAVAELDGLPDTSRMDMVAWQTLAQTRLAALDAVDDLTYRLNSN